MRWRDVIVPLVLTLLPLTAEPAQYGPRVRTANVASLPTPLPYPYDEKADAGARVAEAFSRAKNSGKRVLIDFGGNWCPDCHVLDGYFHDAANRPLLKADFLLVHVNIGRLDQNLDLAERYQIPLNKGVPALAVLDSDGKLLYSQRTGEFEAMRRMQSSAVTAFLTQWKPAALR